MENTLLNITGSFDMETRNLISYSLTDIFETDKIRIELLGEIYYKNIKLELHEFAGLYKIYGISLIKNITGMFLIIIFDTKTKELKIFQDITTSYFNLYYTVYGGVFYYSTSLKKVMKLSHVPVTLNNKKIQEFMRNGFILDSNTLVTEINKLEYFSYISVNNTLRICGIDYNDSNNFTKEQVLKNWDSMLRESILRVYSEAGEANITLSSGFDSNYILYTLANYTNSSINAFCIGGEKGINEISEVTKIAKFYGINLLVDTVMSQDLEYFPDIVWRLEGSLFECGVILQYYLGRLLFQKGNTSILCGESADEIMTFKYHSVNYNQFCNDKQKSVYFSYSDYPFYVTNSIVLKKNSLLLHSFGIHPRYPYKMSEIVEMSKKISDLNDKKEFHKKNCELRFQDSVLDNINSVPGTTHLFSCLNIQTLVKIILYIFRYNSCMKIFNFRDKELIFFNKIVNGLIQNIEENLEDDIERILKYLYICLFNEIFIIKNKVNFFDDVEFNQTLSEFLDKL